MTIPVRVQDVVDIAVVALVVYVILRLIRGTRAVELAQGLLILVGLYLVSVWLGLYTLQWILGYLGVVIPIALLILFQPELRRILEQLGRGGFAVSLTGSALEREVAIRLAGDIARAARVFAQRRIGALIAIERRTGLEDFVETGIRVDAVVTVQLLVSLFFPNTPLHDGAVIIRGNRVVAASCLLPLSENPKAATTLGTRHRAALGITEVTDAVAVVVSEETGMISFARAGELQRGLSEEELKATLLGLFAPASRAALAVWPWRRAAS